MLRWQPRSRLFPYTTLFRSHAHAASARGGGLCQRAGDRAALREASEALARALSGPRGASQSRGGRQIEHVRELRMRSEEHTSELQSRGHLVCRLLLEKKHKE